MAMVEGGKRRWSLPDSDGFAAKGDFDVIDLITGRQDGFHASEDVRRELDVVGRPAGVVVKMGVRVQIRAVAGGAAIKVHRPDQLALNQGLEAVVHRGEGDAGQLRPYPGIDFVGRGMIAALEQRGIKSFPPR